MYVCKPCVEEFKLAVMEDADEACGACEVCPSFLRDSRGFELAWVTELERPYGREDKSILEQLKDLGRILPL